ncbi:hypothetical protein ONE63_010029 [Megalurothrips usitatus]|uniref:Alpha-ketoglutarate-dependent dioxygenase alkB homolog 7, mitochondrial n=1 Tax=Megalurothrips usitatus TaxID=439358 RepID=A0AAV7XP35_9NEOP|nr:hypothetical protein ONE63_010029 [Megalurothrips usitatus]
MLRLGSVLFLQQIPFKGKWINKHEALIRRECQHSAYLQEGQEVSLPKPNYMTVSSSLAPEECQALYKDMVILDNFLSESEEKTIFDEIEPYMNRLHYEYDHWDNAIHGFRETERLHWTKPSMSILDRVRKTAFPDGKPQLKHVHVLDLSADGYIKPHIDSVKFCGDTIAGLSLLSDSVMRLINDKDNSKIADVLLRQRSLYIMRNSARYKYTHEILGRDVSKFNSVVVPRGRRISVICRSEVSK